jgi:hypothetical protein
MLEAAQTLRELIAGLSVAAYLADRKTQLAVERAIEILGEAARRVSPTVQQAHPEIRGRASLPSATSSPTNMERSSRSGCGCWRRCTSTT